LAWHGAAVAFPADSPKEAKEIASEKALSTNLPIIFLDHRQAFDAQRDDGVFVIEQKNGKFDEGQSEFLERFRLRQEFEGIV
jgi:hypothetical protein